METEVFSWMIFMCGVYKLGTLRITVMEAD